jgi:biopolymer transport protein ExbD
VKTGYYIVLIIFIILIAAARIFIDVFIRYKRHGVKGVKTYFKMFVIMAVCAVTIIFISTSIYSVLPKYETGIDVSIINNNELNIEIIINGDIYSTSDNKKIISVNHKSGVIGIKTENNNNTTVYFTNNASVFQFNKKINVKIKSNGIKINSLFVSMVKSIENHQNYDSIMEIINKR